MSARRLLLVQLVMLLGLIGCKATLYKLSDRAANHLNQAPFADQNRSTLPLLVPTEYPLVSAFPKLEHGLKRVPLCDCPTPVQALPLLESTEMPRLYLKNDGLTNSALYGGNKLRKLELLMAQVLHSGKSELLMTGTVGSNSVAGTAIVARHLGISSDIHLIPQLPSPRVTTNLLVLTRTLADTNGRMTYHHSPAAAGRAISKRAVQGYVNPKILPFICPPGATNPLSTIAYVNAAYELSQDITTGRLPKAPDRIYVPAGSGGTFLGLLIGTKALPLLHGTQIIAVNSGSNRPTAQYLQHSRDVLRYLEELTAGSFPDIRITAAELNSIVDRQAVGAYAVITDEGTEALQLASTVGLKLEHTYTAKTVGRMLSDARAQTASSDELWLYWHTHTADAAAYTALSDPRVTEKDLTLLRQHFSEEVLVEYGLVEAD